MRRRDFLALATAFAVGWPIPVRAQGAADFRRIGFLGNSTPELEANLLVPFREGLRELGYQEDQNIEIVYRWAEGKYERFPELIRDLLATEFNVIVTVGTPASLAVTKEAPSTPLVMIAVGDPVGTGLAESLARPGGMATGLTSIAPELEGKRLELLREATPDVSYIAVLWNPSNAFMVRSANEIEIATRLLGMRVLSLGVTNLAELGHALEKILREQPDALNVLADRLFLHNREMIMKFALENGLPGVHAYRELVEAGGLMSYGPSYADMHRRAANYVDEILKGTSPADLPIEAPTKFVLVLNLRTADALGVDFPASLLTRADELLE